MDCQLTQPKTFENTPPTTSKDFWQFSKMVCSTTQTELIQNASTGAEFYINKSASYGDFLILTFLIIFLIFGIVKFLVNFIIPKRINFKR
jgi:hypothetical protein